MLSLAPVDLLAHGDFHVQIEALNQSLRAEPYRGDLQLRRAVLHLHHGDWDNALRDCNRAEELAGTPDHLPLVRARILIARGDLDGGMLEVSEFLETHPSHPDALLLQAQVYEKRCEWEPAHKTWNQAIQHLPNPEPRHYLQWSRVAVRLEDGFARATQCLEAGIRRLGSNIIFQTELLELELSAGWHDAALLRLDSLIRESRKPAWLLTRRAEILLELHRLSEARDAFEQALEQFREWPAPQRQTAAARELRKRIQQGRIQTRPTASAKPLTRPITTHP